MSVAISKHYINSSNMTVFPTRILYLDNPKYIYLATHLSILHFILFIEQVALHITLVCLPYVFLFTDGEVRCKCQWLDLS